MRFPDHSQSHIAPKTLCAPAYSLAPPLPSPNSHSPCRLRSSLPRSIRVPRAAPEGPILGTICRWL